MIEAPKGEVGLPCSVRPSVWIKNLAVFSPPFQAHPHITTPTPALPRPAPARR